MSIGISDTEGGSRPGIYFDRGDVITHNKYGYRGVVVAVDRSCMAGDAWYFSNKTQPSREQPWYHVLVHDSGGLSTYVAQSNLDEDRTGQPINHPRIKTYFSKFEDGAYILKNTSASSGGCGI